MRDILPQSLVDIIRDRYLAGVADAEAMFDMHEADEDALTGALGQALAMRAPMRFFDGESAFTVNITYRKLRGRGYNAPEKRYGSDGVFQISVIDEQGNAVRTKGLPFQAKTSWSGTNKALYNQAMVGYGEGNTGRHSSRLRAHWLQGLPRKCGRCGWWKSKSRRWRYALTGPNSRK